MNKKMVWAALAAMWLGACASGPDDETLASNMLDKAREAMEKKDYAAARDSIQNMRMLYPKAIQARGAGILLLDSVELISAREELKPIGPELEAARAARNELMEKPHYKKDPLYHEQNRKVFAMEQLYDSIATKVTFFEKKLVLDKEKLKQ